MFSLAEGAQMPRQSWKMTHGIIVVFSKLICVCQLTFSNSKAEAGLENVTVSQAKLVLGKNHLFTTFDIFQLRHQGKLRARREGRRRHSRLAAG